MEGRNDVHTHILTHILSSCSSGTSFAIFFDRDFSERVARPIKMELVPGLWIRPGLNFRDRHHTCSTSVAEQRGVWMGATGMRLRQAQPPHIKAGVSPFELLLGWAEKVLHFLYCQQWMRIEECPESLIVTKRGAFEQSDGEERGEVTVCIWDFSSREMPGGPAAKLMSGEQVPSYTITFHHTLHVKWTHERTCLHT